jgi:hypothetical protein
MGFSLFGIRRLLPFTLCVNFTQIYFLSRSFRFRENVAFFQTWVGLLTGIGTRYSMLAEVTTPLLGAGVVVLSLLWWLSTRRPPGLSPGPGPALPLIGHIYLMDTDPRAQFRLVSVMLLYRARDYRNCYYLFPQMLPEIINLKNIIIKI